MNQSFNGSVRSGRSGRSGGGRSMYSKRSGVQIIDGDSEIDDSDTRSMQSNTMVNVIDDNDPLTKKIFHNNKKGPTVAIDEIDEDKEDDEDFDGSYIDSNSG